MVKIESSTISESKRDNVFSPTRLEVAAFLSAGVFILLAGKASTFFQTAPDAFEVKESFLDVVFDLSTRDLSTRIASGLAWFAVGSLAYLLLWALIVFIIDIYNDVMISASFVHPKSFHQSSYWLAITGRALLRVSSGIILLFLAFLALSAVPYWYGAGAALGGGLSAKDNITITATCILGTAFLLYLATIALRLLFLKRRLF